jgi:hypothetical protein
MEEANGYIRERYLPVHNQTFAVPPREEASAFVAADADWDALFAREAVRQVGRDNVVTCGKVSLQISKQPGRRTCAGLAVVVKQRLDGSWSVHRGAQLLGRYDPDGRPMEAAGPVENRDRTRFPTSTLDGRRTAARRPQLPQGPPLSVEV